MKPLNFYIQLGFSGFLKRFMNRLRSIFFTCSLIFLAIDLDSLRVDVKEPYSFIFATIDDIENYPNYNDFWFGKEKAISRIQDGKHLCVLKKDHKMVCFQWLEFQKAAIGWFNLKMNLPKDIVYETGLYTLPDLRNGKLTYNFKKEILLFLKDKNYRKAFCVIDPNNSVSLHLHKKLGYKEYQTVHYKRYWFIRYFCVNKYKSNQKKRYITVSKTPEVIWKVFL